MSNRSLLSLFVAFSLLGIAGCSQAGLEKAQGISTEVAQVASPQTPPASASPQTQEIHAAVQTVAPIVPFGPEALAVVAALAGAAGTIIQTFRRSSAISSHQAAISELARNVTPEAKLQLSPRSQSILQKSTS